MSQGLLKSRDNDQSVSEKNATLFIDYNYNWTTQSTYALYCTNISLLTLSIISAWYYGKYGLPTKIPSKLGYAQIVKKLPQYTPEE